MIPQDPGRKVAAPTTHGGTTGKSSGKRNTGGGGGDQQYSGMQYVDPLANGTPTADSLGLTDTGSFVKDLATLSNQAAAVKPVQYGAYHPQASQFAGQDIRAQVAPLQTLQQQLLQTGRSQAGLINQAGQSAANLTAPWAQQIFNAYNSLGQQAYNAAGNLSGATRDAGLAEAQSVNNQLARIGSGQLADAGQSTALGSALTGIGNLGGATLGQQGAAAMVGAYGIPQQMSGYAQALAAGTLGAATQEAAKINPQIADIRATRGKLTREYQQDLFKNAQTAQDMKLKTLGMRADIVSSMGSLANASNTQKIQLAQFNQQAIESHNAIVSADRTFRQQERQITQQWKIAMVQDANSDADRVAQVKTANADRAAQMQIARDNREATKQAANATLEVQWAQTKGWYRDSKGRPVALPGNRLVVGKDGKITAVEQPSPAEKATLSSLNSQRDRDRGWQWVNGKRVALPGKTLVYDKKGKFLGAQRDPSQYASSTGSGALSVSKQAELMSGLNTKLEDWAFGKPPDKDTLQTGIGGTKSIPGIDPATGRLRGDPGSPERIAAQKLYEAAGGTAAMPYKDILFRLLTESGGLLSYPQAKAMVDKLFIDRGESPTYAENNNLRLGDQKTGAFSTAGQTYGGH